jgi:hypothetical protein
MTRIRTIATIGTAVCSLSLLGGCVQVTAPDRPIEIVLNINIRQEVVYRLDRDAKELIEQNTEIF